MNTITIELCAEDRARLDAILDALNNGRSCEKCVDSVAQYAAAAATSATQTNEEEPANVETPAAENEQESAPEVKREDVQSLVVTLSAANKKAEVRAIVKEYADRVSAIPEDKLSEVWAKLKVLEG